MSDNNPDKILAESEHVVISSDAWVLDRAKRWLNLGTHIIEQHASEAIVIYSE